MNKEMTTQRNGKWHIARLSTYKREYHGNGKNAWYGQDEIINGHSLQYVSKRYSYRWHKTQVWLDGIRLMTAADYSRAEHELNS